MNSISRKGPVAYRLMVFVFSAVFGVLFYWLLGFVINDIGTWPGPNPTAMEEELLDPQLLQVERSLNEQLEETNRQIRETRDKQQLLKDSIDNAKRTMDQLLEIQRLSLENSSSLSPEQQAAMAKSIELFLTNQQQYQEFNEEISRLNERLVDLQQQQRENSRQLEQARAPVQAQYQRQQQRHNLLMAGLKLAVLIPLLLVVLGLFLLRRNSIYTPLIYAAAIAVAVKVMLVMHEYFPSRYFKYILILVSLAVVTWILVYLLRMIAFPKRDWLLKQYRDAYEAFFCPICSYPIRRGPLRYMAWTRRSLRKAARLWAPASAAIEEETYTCPMCGTELFEKCSNCESVRHSLLPACDKCGAEKTSLVEQAEAGGSI